MELYGRLLTAIQSQESQYYRALVAREEAERNTSAFPARVLTKGSDGNYTVAIGAEGIVEGRSLTNAKLSAGAIVGYFPTNAPEGFVDAPSIS